MARQPLDLEREHTMYYTADDDPREVELGTIPFVTIDGHGPLGGPSYREAADGLAELAEGIQELSEDRGKPFKRAPLETLWLDGVPPERTDTAPSWKLVTRVPAFVHRDLVDDAREDCRAKAAGVASYETIGEGPAIQLLHRGPRNTIGEVYDRLHVVLEEEGLQAEGPAHEIHLDGPTPGERGRTVVRLPAQPID